MKEPKCPSCEIIGTEHITYKINTDQISENAKIFNIAYCTNCGHIYNISPINIPDFLKAREPIDRPGAGPKQKE